MSVVTPYLAIAHHGPPAERERVVEKQFFSGVYRAKIITLDGGGARFVPLSFLAADGGGVLFEGAEPQLVLPASDGTVRLTPTSVRVPGRRPTAVPRFPATQTGFPLTVSTRRPGPLEPAHISAVLDSGWDDASARALVTIILSDRKLQTSLLSLQRNLLMATYEFAAASGVPPVAPVATVMGSVSASYTEQGAPRTVLNCEIGTLTTEVTTCVTTWANKVKTAAQQALECSEACLRLPVLQAAACGVACAATAFVDVVVGTIETVTCVTEKVVSHVEVCVEEYVTPGGVVMELPAGPVDLGGGAVFAGQVTPAIDLPDMAQGAAKVAEWAAGRLGPYKDVLNCFARGEWTLARVRADLPGIDGIPYGIRVCMDRQCVDVLLAAGPRGLWELGKEIKDLIESGAGAEVLLAALVELVGEETLKALAAKLGVDLTLVGAALYVFLILLAYQWLAIQGQLVAGEAFGDAYQHGACFHHPLIVLTAGLFTPVGLLVLPVLANWPIIVTGRAAPVP